MGDVAVAREKQAGPDWLIKDKVPQFSEEVKRLAGPFLDAGASDQELVHQSSIIFNAARNNPPLCGQLTQLLGFDKLVPVYKGQPYFEIPPGGKDIITILERITAVPHDKSGTYPLPITMLFTVVSHGMERGKAQIILDEVTKTRGYITKGDKQSNLWQAFQNTKFILNKTSHAPEWVKERYLQ